MVPAKFAELNYDVPSFNQWINTQVGKLRQRGETSSDLRSHIQSAYVSSNNPKLVTYVEQQKDYMRDNPSFDYTYKLLMNRVKHKYESLQQELLRDQAAAPGKDSLLAIQSQITKIGKEVKKIHGQNRGGNNRNGKNGSKSVSGHGKGNGQQRARNKDPNWKPFPKELRNKPEPSDPSKPLKIDGIDYWFCTTHKNWGRHPTVECRKGMEDGSNSSGNNGSSNSGNDTSGGRNGRAVQALAAIAKLTGGKR